jgi:tRNA-2-methylthio-N6-dimethylallyladenosine synthase
VVEVLVADADGRKDGASLRVSGRAADNRLVHFALPADVAPLPHRADGGSKPGAGGGSAPGAGGGSVPGADDPGADSRLRPDVDPRLRLDVDPRLPRPGDLVTVAVTHGAPHHLVADSAPAGGPYAVRRTRAGDAWAAQARARAGLAGPDDHGHAHGGGHGASVPAGPVVLGLPTVRTA